MESLSGTSWDVVIDGTGLQQSLLALALSRSKKKVLHVDENDYYGGPEAAFSLQDADEWRDKNHGDANSSSLFSNVVIERLDSTAGQDTPKLSYSRAYSLTLSPQIIYAKSRLLAQLVSSKVHKQLEFQAVGNWWIYQAPEDNDDHGDSLKRLPNGREDIFADRSIDVRAKRALTKFLKFVVDFDSQPVIWESHADEALPDFLSNCFQLPLAIQTYITALTLSLKPPSETTVGYSLPRIQRHLTSIGIFGPGFGAVIPKWGGGSEIAQVACRAGAVGGGVYVLATGITSKVARGRELDIKLSNHEDVISKYIVQGSIPGMEERAMTLSRSIVIIDSDLSSLFTSTVEGAPVAAVCVVAFPSGSLVVEDISQDCPVYVMIHSSETGECPAGQCVLYASTISGPTAQKRLALAISKLLSSLSTIAVDETDSPSMAPQSPVELYRLSYDQIGSMNIYPPRAAGDGNLLSLPVPSLDLAFDDAILSHVELAWRQLYESDPDGETKEDDFMVFEDRPGMETDGDPSEDL